MPKGQDRDLPALLIIYMNTEGRGIILKANKGLYLSKIKPYLFLLPTFSLVAVFSYYPFYYAITKSLTDLRLGAAEHFIGIDNFIRLLQDQVFIKSLFNQLLITCTVVFVNIFFPLLAAELLYFIRSERLSKGIKLGFVVPMLVPSIVIILIWKYLFSTYFGVNTVFDMLGLHNLTKDWLNDSTTAIWSILAVGFPFVSGLYFLIFHAALNSIPKEMQESAQIDGCNALQIVRYIHIPGLLPYFNIVAILCIISSLQNFGLVAAMTNGGPGYQTYIPALHMYKVAFGSYEIGYASSMGVIMFLFIMSFSIISQKITKSR